MKTASKLARGAGLCLALALLGINAAQAAQSLRLERAVVLMRHGVRPPTKWPPMPAGTAADPWPQWNVPPGYLTNHGAAALRLLGASDRGWLASQGLVARQGCPAPGEVAVWSDSDQRTIATGDAWLAGFAPGCALYNGHVPQDQPDPMFAGADGDAGFDPVRADAAVAAALGAPGIRGAEDAQRSALTTLDRILCGTQANHCGVSGTPTAVLPAKPGKKPKLAGALDSGSTAAQTLLLEYAEGMPLASAGWGRASGADIETLSALHAAEFAIVARPQYIAARNIEPVLRRMVAALTDGAIGAPRVTALMGHDTQVASLGGLLGLHWKPPGYAADDPPPGGAIVLLLLRDAQGNRFVRVQFRAQSLEQLRTLASLDKAGPYRADLTIDGCDATCPLPQFLNVVDARLAR